MAEIFEPRGFSILDVENLRTHYARTLAHWLERYESCVEHVRQMFGDSFVRMWRLYLAGSEAAFTSGDLQLFQVVFARPRNNRIPWTREHLYRQEPASGRQ
jgi:cyclopropane-fatty-acyl-phospholipid synthase